MKDFPLENVQKVLIRSANWVGDAILSTPAIRAVRKNFPSAQITLLAKPWVAPVFYHNPSVDKIMDYDVAGRHAGLWGKIRLAGDLRRRGFDLAFLLQNAFEAALLSFLAGIPFRLGYRTDARRFLLTHGVAVTPPLKRSHQIDYYLGILRGLGLRLDGRDLALVITEEERNRGEDILRKLGIKPTDFLVGINPGAKYGTAKRWFPERYARFCKVLRNSLGTRILIFGAPEDRELGDQIGKMIGGGSANLAGKTDLREAMALIERCRLFVTNDSGLMHVAAALNVPQIAIIGSTDHGVTGPTNPWSRVVRVPTSCSPCLKPDCPTDHHCMGDITVEMVLSAAEALLEEIGHRGVPQTSVHSPPL